MNLDPQTPNGARNRSIVKILAGLLAAGVVIGLLTGLLSAGAMRALGFRPDATQTPAGAPATPKSSPTTAKTSEPTEPTETTPTPTTDDTGSKNKDNKKKHKDKDKRRDPRLDASPAQVSAGERINLSGVFPGLEEGVVLQVQRREDGSWQDFPVVARTDADGTFETWVISGRTGKTKFRMKAEGSGRKTPPAAVLIG